MQIAISGIVVIGGILLIREADPSDYVTLTLGCFGIVLAMINVVGGFAVTNRMLRNVFKEEILEHVFQIYN